MVGKGTSFRVPLWECLERFAESVGKGKSISLTMITAKGITHTVHWGDIYRTVTAEDLFE